MYVLYADKNRLVVQRREPVTSGSVNACVARFGFSPDWDGMERVAVFKAGAASRSVLLDESGECIVPWEVLVKHSVQLQAGVYGTRGGEVVLPTIWANLGTILEGVSAGEAARPPTPELWEQELAQKGDALGYTPSGKLGLYAGDRLLSSVPVAGVGSDGMSDHRLLANRDAEGQHPIGAITGLER
ncbi:MAG: hypothetical protein K2K53_12350, partial [Oscillospiraceae bacterium]|nr:hypothetical protein [Oscillospiraceae bacterium]